MTRQEIFRILDADTDLTASLSFSEGHETLLVLSQPDRGETIVLSVADFRRMAAAVQRHTE